MNASPEDAKFVSDLVCLFPLQHIRQTNFTVAAERGLEC